MKTWKYKADYFIKKPYDQAELLEAAKRIRLLSERQKKRISVKTFGDFELLIDNKSVELTDEKGKELLALCVDRRGGMVSEEEAVSILWEKNTGDIRSSDLYRKTVAKLEHILGRNGISHFFLTAPGACSIDCGKLNCDLYDCLNGKEEAIADFRMRGVYLTEYSWAEKTFRNLVRYTRLYEGGVKK